MELKVSTIIQSHLNDAKIEISFNPELAETRLNFVKYLIFNFPDTNHEINPRAEFKKFLNK